MTFLTPYQFLITALENTRAMLEAMLLVVVSYMQMFSDLKRRFLERSLEEQHILSDNTNVVLFDNLYIATHE